MQIPLLFSFFLGTALITLVPPSLCAQQSEALLPVPATSASASASVSAVAAAGRRRPQTVPIAAAPKERRDLVLGPWTGSLSLPGSTLSLLITIVRTASGLSAQLDIPGGPVRQRRLYIIQRGDSLRINEPEMGMNYDCALSADAASLNGVWNQVSLHLPVVMHRGQPAASANGQRVTRLKVDSKWENGELENEKPIGVWNYYRRDYASDYASDYVLYRTYDYTAGKLTFARPDNERYEVLLPNGQWQTKLLTEAPWFIGSHDFLARLTAKIVYPEAAMRSRREGTVWVSFVVDTQGHLLDPQLVRGLGSGLDEEAMRLLRSIPSTFTPGRDGTTVVTSRRMMAIVFKL